MDFFNFFKRSLRYLLFFIVLFLALLGLSALFGRYIKVLPITGISECKSFINGTIPDIESCKVIPGSLAIMVTKDSPLFSFVQPSSVILLNFSYYALTLFILCLVAAAVYYYANKINLSLLFAALALASFYISAILASPVTKEDLVCYKPENVNFVICHTYLGIDDGKVILKPSRYDIIEEVPVDWVVGKIAFVGNPVFGKLLLIYQSLTEFAKSLLSIVYKGYVPTEYKIYYLIEK